VKGVDFYLTFYVSGGTLILVWMNVLCGNSVNIRVFNKQTTSNDAECWIACMVDQCSCNTLVFAGMEWLPTRLLSSFGQEPKLDDWKTTTVNQEEWLDFVELTLSHWM